jgi:hypothetical protein
MDAHHAGHEVRWQAWACESTSTARIQHDSGMRKLMSIRVVLQASIIFGDDNLDRLHEVNPLLLDQALLASDLLVSPSCRF